MEGIQYCEERNLDSWTLYLLSLKAKLNFETSNWEESYSLANKLIKNENLPIPVTINTLIVIATIKMRRGGEDDPLPLLLEAKAKAFEIMEMQRVIPSLIALLEYEWLTGKTVIAKKDIDRAISNNEQTTDNIENSQFAFWLLKARKHHLPIEETYEGYEVNTVIKAQKAAALWSKLGCCFEQALSLFEGNDDDKRKAIKIVHRAWR